MTDRASVQVLDAPTGGPAQGHTRSTFLRRTAVAGGALAASGAVMSTLPGFAFGAVGAEQDVEVLNFALTLEYLEAEFYTVAEKNNFLMGEAAEFAKVVGAHEREHVQTLETVLGDKKVKKPTFNFGNAVRDQATFLATAIVLEDTGVSAYNGQAPRVTKPVLAVAASIVSVEARHAAWVRDIVYKRPAPVAFDQAKTMDEILAAVKATGFITG